MAAPFPHHYEVSLTRTAPSQAIVEAPPRVGITGGPPPEFDGQPHHWSPEHLLLASIGLCLQTTFEALARRVPLTVLSWASRASSVLDKTADGLAFTAFRVDVTVAVAAGDAAAAEALIARAKRHCIVSRALRLPVEIVVTCMPVDVAA